MRFFESKSIVGVLGALLLALSSIYGAGQTPAGMRYFYDDVGRLIKAIDNAGNEVDYLYDATGNIIDISRNIAPSSNSIAILNFVPQTAGAGAIITIQGQNFGALPSANTVKFNGSNAAVLAATLSTITVVVPQSATTGPISITVNGQTVTSGGLFTVIPLPAISSISPRYSVSSTNSSTPLTLAVTGINLTGASFSFVPAFTPANIIVNSANVDPSGASATLNVTVATGVKGSYVLVANTAGGVSTLVGSAADVFQLMDLDGDADGDGLTNAVELALGTDPLGVQTSNTGLPDGWQVFYGLNPLSAASAGPDPVGSGATALQDFQLGFSPRSADRTPPVVALSAPPNGATEVPINSRVVARFQKLLQSGVSLAAAQSAISAALAGNSTVSPGSVAIAATTLQSYMNRTCCGNSVSSGLITVMGPFGPVAGGVTASSDGMSLTFVPSQPFQSKTTYTVQVVGAKDTSGNVMKVPFDSSFSTSSALDQTGLTLVSLTPANGASSVPVSAPVVAAFSEVLDPSTLTASTFVVTDATTGTPVSGSFMFNSAGDTLTFTPDQSLAVGHVFTVNLTGGIQDLAGNALNGSFGFAFTTAAVTQEFDTLSFALLNGISPIPLTATIHEYDTLSFALLNGVSPLPSTITAREYDTLSFSVLNGVSPILVTSYIQELDGLTFSILNGDTPLGGTTVYEVDSATFSIQNTTH